MAMAQGQFTIIDYNDAITLSGYLSSTVSKTQRYMKDSGARVPDWDKDADGATPPKITPHLFRAGTSDDLISTEIDNIEYIKWYLNNSTTPIATGSGSPFEYETKTIGQGSRSLNTSLKIIKNILDQTDSGAEIRCEIGYYDNTTKMTIVQNLTISFSLSLDGGGLVAIEVTTPNGEVFKNSSVESLPIQTKLFRGTTWDKDDVEYQWAFQNSEITSSSSKYHEKFGAGWEVITLGTTPGFSRDSQGSNNVLVVYSSAVPSMLTIKCAAIDKEATPNVWYIDGVTLVDRSDPLEIIISSTGGNIFKNGTGSTDLTAHVYQGGNELDAEDCDFEWTKYDQNGNIVPNWKKVTQTISLGSSDIDVKNTFYCKVTYPAE